MWNHLYALHVFKYITRNHFITSKKGTPPQKWAEPAEIVSAKAGNMLQRHQFQCYRWILIIS